MADEPVLKALYSPSKRQIGCAILAAAFRTDRQVNAIVHPRDWFMNQPDDMTVLSGTAAEWRRFAASTPEQRPGPEHFPPRKQVRQASASGTEGESE